MDMFSFTRQAISILAMVVYIISYCQKKQKTIITLQCIATILFSISFAMLGAIMGTILNIMSAIRAVLFMYREKLKTDNKIWLVGFLISYAATYVLVFTVFKKEFTVFNAIIELLPIIGMVATTFGYRAKSGKAVRISGLINEPVWLVYNIFAQSIGAVIANSFSLCSICLGLIRDKKDEKSKS